MKRDQKFFDMYSLVIGVLAIIALLIFVGSMKLSEMTQGVYTTDDKAYQAAVLERIEPLGKVYMPGDEAKADSPRAEPAPAPKPVEAALSGPQVYNQVCLVCHGSGIGGAPMISDPQAWAPRIAEGKDTLYEHALDGFTGQSGSMPPKGGRLDLSDEEVKSAVDYMVSQAGDK